MATPHILIVDDIAKNIQVAANVLKSEDCHISFAQSGGKALEILDKEFIHLVLLDVMMPEMDGFEVCQRIKENPKLKHIPIIFLTAKTDVASITNAFQLGGIDYISKPFNNEELLARVRTQLSMHKAMQTIRAQKHTLEETNAVKDKLFSIIAHDLRNPFNGLLVLTDILRFRLDKMSEEEIRDMIDLIYLSSKDGYDLLENLLEWSRTQRNQIDFNPTQVNLTKLIHGNIQLVKPMAVSKQINLVTDIDDEIVAHADRHMLDTVIRNLITNAIKFTKKDGTVTIKGEKQPGKFIFTVEDSGIGIDKNELDKLFNNTTQKTTIGTANEKGTGLGLLLCKEFVDEHKGEIWVESEMNVGSKFLFSIPMGQNFN